MAYQSWEQAYVAQEQEREYLEGITEAAYTYQPTAEDWKEFEEWSREYEKADPPREPTTEEWREWGYSDVDADVPEPGG